MKNQIGNSVNTFEKESRSDDSLFVKLRGCLILGKCFGVIPLSGIYGHHYQSVRLSFPAIVSMIIILLLGFSSSLSILATIRYHKANALDIAESIHLTVVNVWGLFCYVYFCTGASRLIAMFHTWELNSLFHTLADNSFKRDIAFIFIIIISSSVCEFTLYFCEYFPKFDDITSRENITTVKFNTTLETYYMISHGYWHTALGYHPMLGVLALFTDLFRTLGWNYVDFMLIVFSRAMYVKFKGLCAVAEENLQYYQSPSETFRSFTLADQLSWEHIVKDHDTLCMLLESIQKFASPLIFGSYATNIYYICMQLIYDITPEKVEDNMIHSVFTLIILLNLVMRVFLLTFTAGKINSYAHDLGHILKRCPILLYNDEVQRVHKQINSGPDIGLSGLGCFTITRPFMMSIVNVVFTVEIVLLSSHDSLSSCFSN